MKKPKCIISKQDYSVLTVLLCATIGSILLLFVVWLSPQGHLFERVVWTIMMTLTALGAGTIFVCYIIYLKKCCKEEQTEDADDIE